MSTKQAIKIAVEAIDAEIKRLAVNANLYEQYGMKNQTGETASNKRKQLREAKEILLNSLTKE